ncbi:MAG: metal ABC transporter permease [bacterium]
MSWDIVLPALLAGLVVLSTHVPLGQQVLRRGIIFIDLAVAQIAGLGVILATVLLHDPAGWQIQAGAFAAAVIGALGLHWCEKRWPDIQEAIIGTVFVLAVTAALILLSEDPHGSERLKELLAGQVLWVTVSDLWLPALISIIVLMFWFWSNNTQRTAGFYILFAVSVTVAVQLVGVYLVFASLIIPALGVGKTGKLFYGYLVGIVGYMAGILLSVWLDLPTGPMIVWTLAFIALLFSISRRLKSAQV